MMCEKRENEKRRGGLGRFGHERVLKALEESGLTRKEFTSRTSSREATIFSGKGIFVETAWDIHCSGLASFYFLAGITDNLKVPERGSLLVCDIENMSEEEVVILFCANKEEEVVIRTLINIGESFSRVAEIVIKMRKNASVPRLTF